MDAYKLLRDGAFVGQALPRVIAPKRDNGALTEADELHNSKIRRGRVVVEQEEV